MAAKLKLDERMFSSQKSPYNFEVMDSKAEIAFAETLDRSKSVMYWTKKHGIEIPYRSFDNRLKTRAYHPDFWVKFKNGNFVLFEVKGHHMKNQKDVAEKKIAADLWCLARGCRYEMKYDDQVHSL